MGGHQFKYNIQHDAQFHVNVGLSSSERASLSVFCSNVPMSGVVGSDNRVPPSVGRRRSAFYCVASKDSHKYDI